MAKDLTVAGTPYTFPEQGESPPWGENITDWASAVTDRLAGIVSDTDINNSQASLIVTASPTSISGFTFDYTRVRGFVAEYTIYKTTGSETGILLGNYNGSSWSVARQATDDVGVEFSITGSGQVQYKNSGVTGTLKFAARTKAQ
jgi:hypothetical protein